MVSSSMLLVLTILLLELCKTTSTQRMGVVERTRMSLISAARRIQSVRAACNHLDFSQQRREDRLGVAVRNDDLQAVVCVVWHERNEAIDAHCKRAPRITRFTLAETVIKVGISLAALLLHTEHAWCVSALLQTRAAYLNALPSVSASTPIVCAHCLTISLRRSTICNQNENERW